MVRKPALRKDDPQGRANLLVVFSLGLFAAAYVLTSGGSGGSAAPSSFVGQNVTVTQDCDWVRSLVQSIPVVQWEEGMSALCGTSGKVLAYNKAVGLVKIQHENGKIYAWPSGATSMDPKAVSLQFLHNRVRRAHSVATELEKHLDIPDLESEELASIKPSLTPPPAAGTPDTLPGGPPPAPPSGGSGKRSSKISKVRFVHVPKAGGTAFTTALRVAVGCSAEPCIGDPSAQTPCAGVMGCYGHEAFNKGDVSRRQAGEVDLLVLNVRKPVDRLVSAFHHGQREWPCCGLLMRPAFRDRLYKATSNPNAFTLATFADDPSTKNCITKMIAGKPCKAELEVTADLYDRATANLAFFDVVLIMEEFEASLALLQCVTGADLSDPSLTTKVRMGSYEATEDDTERQAIASANRWDIKIYEEAVKRFCEIYRQQQCSFQLPAGLCTGG